MDRKIPLDEIVLLFQNGDSELEVPLAGKDGVLGYIVASNARGFPEFDYYTGEPDRRYDKMAAIRRSMYSIEFENLSDDTISYKTTDGKALQIPGREGRILYNSDFGYEPDDYGLVMKVISFLEKDFDISVKLRKGAATDLPKVVQKPSGPGIDNYHGLEPLE
jgi:hypothetical protein